ncbi:hypothetical protein IPJ72_00135 [Candidatus Peregrinibacteria bacterium]|nr:MAG: hypothetical protein IPJ72_00135 [Candidatus Peregrinibacteria bacterium]
MNNRLVPPSACADLIAFSGETVNGKVTGFVSRTRNSIFGDLTMRLPQAAEAHSDRGVTPVVPTPDLSNPGLGSALSGSRSMPGEQVPWQPGPFPTWNELVQTGRGTPQ